MTAALQRTWLITGISSGLGRALAEAVLARGDRVVGTARGETTSKEFSALAPGRSIGIILDVTDEKAVKRAIAQVEKEIGPIDILVNNAGYGLVGGVEETSLEETRAQFETNVFGVLAVLKAALPFMRARRKGRIINITSVSGLVGWASLGIYTGSKFALEGISETLALELAPLGIKVIMIEPGGLRTDFATRSRRFTAQTIDDYAATVGHNRGLLAEHAGHEPGDPARAAEAIVNVAIMDEPPLRLLIGSDAVLYADTKLRAQMDEIRRWESVSRSSDYPQTPA
jgi:NAD(P)-dependent dehydrogenase (short-subunit alcohol dehydrogenase family)